MNDAFAIRVRAAATALWWTVLIAVLWVMAMWLLWMGLLHSRPDFVIWAMGGSVTGDQVHWVMIVAIMVARFFVLILILTAIWLSFWARRLRRLTQ